MTDIPPVGANSLAARDVAHVLHPYTELQSHLQHGPMVITRGEGVRVFDDAGRGYIDCMAGLWCASLGFSEPRLVAAATRQLERLPFYHTFTARANAPMIELAEMLLARAPVPMGKAFFANSGSEANDSAVKMIWYYNNALGRPHKKKIIGRLKAYHGVTIGAASLTGLPYNHRQFDLPLPGFLHTMTPHHYHDAEPDETEEQFATRCAEALDVLIQAEGPDTVAAFFAEPIMGAGGVIIPPRTYFDKIQAVLRKYDVLLVADEVVCGFGRTGHYWGSQTYGMCPDILTCAKALSAAYMPISAVLVTDTIFQALARQSNEIGTFGHGFTYSGHPVAAAVAVETLKIYDEMDVVQRVRDLEGLFQARLHAFADHPLVGEVRGVGLIGGIELVADKVARRNFNPGLKVNARIIRHCLDRGIIARVLPNDTMAFSPPLTITETEINEMFDKVEESLDTLQGERADSQHQW